MEEVARWLKDMCGLNGTKNFLFLGQCTVKHHKRCVYCLSALIVDIKVTMSSFPCVAKAFAAA